MLNIQGRGEVHTGTGGKTWRKETTCKNRSTEQRLIWKLMRGVGWKDIHCINQVNVRKKWRASVKMVSTRIWELCLTELVDTVGEPSFSVIYHVGNYSIYMHSLMFIYLSSKDCDSLNVKICYCKVCCITDGKIHSQKLFYLLIAK